MGTFGAGYGTGIVGGGIGFGAPVVETFGSTLAPSFATAPVVGSISAGLPMTTMAAPTMTTMEPQSVLLDLPSSAPVMDSHLRFSRWPLQTQGLHQLGCMKDADDSIQFCAYLASLRTLDT